jgi:hypothetical protein
MLFREPRRTVSAARFLSQKALARTAARLAGRFDHRHYIPLWYPPSAVNAPRYGHGRPSHARLLALLQAHESSYRAHLNRVVAYEDSLAGISAEEDGDLEPYWRQGWIPPLDAMTLYVFLRDRSPDHYVEIGSGMSTRFVHRAIRDGRLSTRVTSIDPAPRDQIDAICDRVDRHPLEVANLGPV